MLWLAHSYARGERRVVPARVNKLGFPAAGWNGGVLVRSSSIMKKAIVVMIFAAVLAAGLFGLIVPRHVLNTFGFATADCGTQNC